MKKLLKFTWTQLKRVYDIYALLCDTDGPNNKNERSERTSDEEKSAEVCPPSNTRYIESEGCSWDHAHRVGNNHVILSRYYSVLNLLEIYTYTSQMKLL